MNYIESMNATEKESSEERESLDESRLEDAVEHPLEHEKSVQEPPANPHRRHYEAFLHELEKQPDAEAKLQFAIDFMEKSLAQGGAPHFKSFWDARLLCLQLFKENISPALRSILWTKYDELSKEARRLKDILDEQSAFAVEQIEMAVKALEGDISAFDEHLLKMATVEFEIQSQSLIPHLSQYQQCQHQLNLLNTLAVRINAMRKELIRTEMRIKQKNKFFQRLSIAGDLVFPRRKELIKEISQHFIEDVDGFVNKHFSADAQHALFSLREEIKALQNMAKILTLNTHAFTHTRMCLSECWDKIKVEEKERKKERAQQKVVFKHNFEESMQKLKEFSDAYKADQIPQSEAAKKLEETGSYIRSLELDRNERNLLREEFYAIRRLLQEREHAEEHARQHQDHEREKMRRQKIQEIKTEVAALLKGSEALDADALTSQRDALLEKMNAISIAKIEKQEIERQMKPLKDLISEKQENSLLKLSDNDRQSIQQLKEVLKQKKERRQEIKKQLEISRKASGSSGLDIAQALNCNAQFAEEKERLEKLNQSIKKLEQEIQQLERR